MEQNRKSKKEKKIIFSEETDSKINGFALAIAFVLVGFLLTYDKNYFGSETVSNIIRWIFIVIGICGLIAELPKIRKGNIKGIDDFLLGLLFVVLWFVFYIFFNKWYFNVVGFLFLVIGTFGLFKGLLEIFYSIKCSYKTEKEKKSSLFTDILLLITEILGLVLVAVQIFQQIKVIPS